ncbi:InlB B-repeat-containing protein [Geotalea uraniireducens]|uniref:Tfp pilus assembly protein tip-associated adhesin PilY1-like protein n=1 Tax=Geotalea uraniireducens (strain Rf4) TaxID=351605 RepID=A5GEY9_GEOUR|nr:Tfp pilus assembly protein tip-associated adhesin PilY1-like protein [Geotalea uraniireducens]ABQ25994.1 Tfp pilus assembly protein tip-associated adhesin PilY1-like protein [Geotalea uraniireducens Rf4]
MNNVNFVNRKILRYLLPLLLIIPWLLASVQPASAEKVEVTVEWGSNAAGDNDNGGYVTPPGNGDSGKDVKVTTNTNKTFTIFTDSGFQISDVRLINKDSGTNQSVFTPVNMLGAGDTYTFNVGTSDWILRVFFIPKTGSNVTITATAGANGSISPSGAISVARNGSKTFTMTPNAGYIIGDVLVDGISVGAVSSYTFPNVTIDHTISVSFVPQAYTITATAGANGVISPAGATNVAKNADQTFNIIPNAGYNVLDVKIDGTSVGARTSYTFTNVTANHTINVTFALQTTSMGNYCQQPSFIGSITQLKPNVLILSDNSGSMGWLAYESETYNNAKSYYGYFDPQKMYKNSGTVFTIDTTKILDKNDIMSGNYLNWQMMRRIDVVRKALIGGKVVNRTAATKYLSANGGFTVEYGPTEPTGIIQALDGKVRFGLMFFRSNYEGGYIAAPIGSTAADLVTQIEAKNPSGNTPLAESIYEATKYFGHVASAYDAAVDYSTWADPILYPCQKNFMLVVTDGEPTADINFPGFDTTTWKNKITANGDTHSPYFMEDVAYYAHVTDLRPDTGTVGNPPIAAGGIQNLTIYNVFVFGSAASKTMQLAAKYGGFQDKNENGKPDLAIEWNKSGDGVPDTYFEAQEGDSLETSLMDALTNILARISSGTAASILSNSEGTGANLLQALFYPNKIFEKQTQANWLGEMQNLWYYIDPFFTNSSVREDTDYTDADRAVNKNHVFNLLADKATNFFFDNAATKQTLVDLSYDTNGDGAPDLFDKRVTPDEVNSIWRAGKQLWSRDLSTNPRKIYTTIDGSTLVPFVETAGANPLRAYLQAATDAEANKIIRYVQGFDFPDDTSMRSRTVKIGNIPSTNVTDPAYKTNPKDKGIGVWKLGDIVNSTPRLVSALPLNFYDKAPDKGYRDKSYGDSKNGTGYIYTSDYKRRGLSLAGANDGMLHAFKLGTLDVTAYGDTKATLSGTNLGDELWAYVPKNVLPYLKYFSDPDYCHLCYVDISPYIVDASIAKPAACMEAKAEDCTKDLTSWRTVVIGGMGQGGASRDKAGTCKDATGVDCVKSPLDGVGFSSYYALDITKQFVSSGNPVMPTLLWEFAHPELGYSTSGPVVMRINGKDNSKSPPVPDPTKNGNWYAVFASGPTGPISGQQFLGKSDQNLKLFVLNLKTGALLRVIDTGIPFAFSGSLNDGHSDTDRVDPENRGFYSDDALYIGYTKRAGAGTVASPYTWTDGGVVRLLTKEDPDPNNWTVSKVIDGIGPVTTRISKLQDKIDNILWLFFGTGRYYYGADDIAVQRTLFGVKDPCFKAVVTHLDGTVSKKGDIDEACTEAPVTKSSLDIQTNISATSLTSKGWYIELDAASGGYGAERIITDTVAQQNGLCFFTSFKPNMDVCSFGGSSHLWVVDCATGTAPKVNALKGRALIQVSTGSFESVDFGTALIERGNRRSAPMIGKPPGEPPTIQSQANNKPVKKILRIREK